MAGMSVQASIHPGPLALLGGEGLRFESGPLWESLADLIPTDNKAVALLPTALAGGKVGAAERRVALAADRLQALGFSPYAVNILSREDAADPALVAQMQKADAVFLLGGGPRRLADTLRDTPAWRGLLERHAAGVLLIATGGAVAALGQQAIMPRQPHPAALDELAYDTFAGLALLTDLCLLPYYGWLADPVLDRVREATPGLPLLGIDDQAALLWTGAEWRVTGLGSLTLWSSDGLRHLMDTGQTVPADLLPPYRKAPTHE